MSRRLMYWQVYLHKTSVASEKMLVNTLTRAKELALRGVELFASPALRFFLYHPIDKKEFYNSPDCLENFIQLDDNDIMDCTESLEQSQRCGIVHSESWND